MVEHTTIQGDTWDYLAFKYYGNEYLFGLILQANTQYAGLNILPSNVKLTIPDKPTVSSHIKTSPFGD